MPLLTTASADRVVLAAALARPRALTVVLLCAEWCDTCREFRATALRLAQAHADVAFVWLDIEDDEAVVGDIDVENFPTLAVLRDGAVLHYGVSLPHEGGIARLVTALDGHAAAVDAPLAVRGLAARLAARSA